jgi:hypothetical protein
MKLLQRVLRKVAVLVVDRLDARAIHRQQLAPEKTDMRPPVKASAMLETVPVPASRTPLR